MDKILFSVSFFLLLLPLVYSVRVTCLTTTLFGNTCLARVGSSTAKITRVSEEKPGKVCTLDKDYGFLYYSARMSYLWVSYECGGTYIVTSPNAGSEWGLWSPWTACSAKCGPGTRTRTRTCPTGTNSDCSSGTNDGVSTSACTGVDCASWNPWGSWTACSLTCGTGVQSRIRTCSTNINSDCSTNSNANLENRVCNTQACAGTGPTNNAFCGQTGTTLGYRIINGSEAGACQYPWMVMIYNGQKGTSCGGSILDSTHILTAAHCLVLESNLLPGQYTVTPHTDVSVYTGSSTMPFRYFASAIPGLVRRRASAVKVHENYNDYTVDNDIAIITLAQPISFDQCHVPICLPTSTQTASGLPGCLVMGWGTTSNSRVARVSSELLYTAVNQVSPTTCARLYGSNWNGQTKLCVGGSGSGSCTGDSGGPLSCPSTDGRHIQYGIVSSGAKLQCGTLAGMYTKVTNFLPWIKANTA